MLDLLLKNGMIITVDSSHTLYERGYLGIQGDTIACLGPMDDTTELPDAVRVIDLAGKPILPGLIDGHGHAGLLRGQEGGGHHPRRRAGQGLRRPRPDARLHHRGSRGHDRQA